MILAIQQAYYLRAMNPSDVETLVTLAKRIAIWTTQKFATRHRIDRGGAGISTASWI